jgi:long-chain fatty acid transport protein
MTKGLTMRLIPALMMFGFAGVASASGFALQNQGGSGNGNAFAGAAAAAEDGSTIFFNPAGMTYLPTGHTISLSGTILDRSIKYKDTGTSRFPANNFGNTGNGGDAGGTALLPHGYWSWSVAPDVWFGVGVGPTFGNKTEYDKNFMGKYAGYMTEIEQININPSLAIKVNEVLSLGLGINFAKANLHLKQGVPVSATNYLELENDGDWGFGANIGAMFQLSPSTRVGVSYRSTIEFDINGQQKLHPNVGGALVSQKIKADGYTTPDSLSIAVSQKLSDRWELLGDYTWTGWSSISDLTVKQKSNEATVTTLSYNFDDTYRIGLGANYKYNDAWKLRFGVAYDKTPVKSNADRTMTLPDSDRTWLSFGGKYTLSKQASLDFGYSHIFFKDAKTARFVNGTALGVGTSTVRGEWNNNRADLLSVQYNHTF